MGKQFTHFLSLNKQITEKGFCYKGFGNCHVLQAEIYTERLITNPSAPGTRRGAVRPPEAPFLPCSASGPSYATQCIQNNETDLKN